MWVNRGMPPFDPSRLMLREKDERNQVEAGIEANPTGILPLK